MRSGVVAEFIRNFFGGVIDVRPGRICLIILTTLVLAVYGPVPVFASAVNWQTYAEGIERSRATDKKMLVSFYADWCEYCVKMSRETYTDSRIVDYLNRNFIPVRVMHDQEQDIVKRYRVQGLPVTWFVDSQGNQISSYPGFVDADQLLPVLKYIHTDSYRGMTFGNFLKSLPD